MSGISLGLFRNPPAEGAVAFWQSWYLDRNGSFAYPGSFVSGPTDTIMGRFGWGDPDTGIVLNTRTSATQLQGFVARLFGTWTHVYNAPDPNNTARTLWYLRAGLPCPLIKAGAYWARFAAGARAGDQVYASLTDGSCISGYNAGAIQSEATPWYVANTCAPNGLALISTWSI